MTNVINKVIRNGTEYQIYAAGGAAGAGDVTGPASSTDADIALFNGTTGKIIKDSGKKLSDYQTALSTQTAYTTKGTATKVPTITTNTLGQVTAITETDITFPVTSVNSQTGAVTGLQTTSNLKTNLTDNSDSYYPSQKAVKTAVDGKQDTLVSGTNIKTVNSTSLLGSGDIAVQPTLVSGTNIKTINSNSILGSGNLDIDGLPSQTGQSGKYLTTDGTTASWGTVSGGITNDTTGTTTTVTKIRAGTEAEYEDLSTKDENTIYYTF